MNKENKCKNTQPYWEDESQNKHQKETRHDVYKVIIDAAGAALERSVGKNKTTTGDFKPVLEVFQTSLLSSQSSPHWK